MEGAMMIRQIFFCGWVLGVLLVSGAWAEGPQWVLVDAAPNESDFSLDKAGVKKSPEGIVTVTVKVAYGPEGKQEALELLKNDKRYADLSTTLYSYDIKCAVSSQRLQRIVHQDSGGAVIREFNLAGKTDWEEVPAGSRMDLVREMVCVSKESD
jgi:hypothetical protein